MPLSPELAELIRKGKNKYARNSGNTVKLKEGKTRFRILPAKDGGKFWFDLGVHWIKTERDGKPVAVVGCNDLVHDKACAVCTAVEKAIKSAVDDDSLNLMKEWKSKKSILLNAIVRSGADVGPDPQIMEMTPTTFGNILSMMDEYAAEFGNVIDINTGMDFIVERKGKGLNTEYTVMPAPKSEPVVKGAMEKLHDLAEFADKQFFKGDETKAITHIANMTGINVSGILAGAAKAGVLTGPSARVVEDDMNFPADEVLPDVKPIVTRPVLVKEATKPVVKAATPAPEPVVAAVIDDSTLEQEDIDAMLAELDA